MDFNDSKVTGVGELVLTDALNVPVFEFKLKGRDQSFSLYPNDNLYPDDELYPGGENKYELEIYVDKNSSLNPSDELKTYSFILNSPLRYIGNTADEFVIESKFDENNNVMMIAKVIRRVDATQNELNVLDNVTIENLEYIPIELFAGTNYIYVKDCEDSEIEITYAKNNELNKFYTTNASYYKHLKNAKENVVNEVNQYLENAYFNDALVKASDGININAKHINADCLISNKDNFHLDERGSLSVNDAVISNSLYTKDLEYMNISQVSRLEVKKEIEPFNNGLEIIKNADLYTYNYKEDKEGTNKHIGLVIGDNFNTPMEVLNSKHDGIDLYAMISVAWQAIKELDEKVSDK